MSNNHKETPWDPVADKSYRFPFKIYVFRKNIVLHNGMCI